MMTIVADASKRKGHIGWGFQVLDGAQVIITGGGAKRVKMESSQAEVFAVICGLREIPDADTVRVVSDCDALMRMLSGQRVKRSWRMREMWNELDEVIGGRHVYASQHPQEFRTNHRWCHSRAKRELNMLLGNGSGSPSRRAKQTRATFKMNLLTPSLMYCSRCRQSAYIATCPLCKSDMSPPVRSTR